VTGPESGTADEGLKAQLDSAQADLERLAELLKGAGRGEVAAADIKRSLENYWQVHEPTLRAAALAVTEPVRLQAIDELNKVREQLAAQREVRASASPPDLGSPA
jgi:hypothetical protein